MNRVYKKGLVSLICPCYNGAKYIDRFIDSLIKQTYKKIELIVVNDGSTDKSEDLILNRKSDIQAEGIILKYISQENGGLGSTFNAALPCAEGEFLCWYGIDDFPKEDFFEKTVAYLKDNSDCGLVRVNGYVVDKNDTSIILGTMAGDITENQVGNLFENAMYQNNFHYGYLLMRMELFDKVNASRHIYPSRDGQNWQLLLPFLYKYKAGYIKEPLYYVIEHKDSLSRRAMNDYGKRIRQLKEYEKIIVTTLDGMNIPNKNYYIDKIKEKYAHHLFCWAAGNCDYALMREEIMYLKMNKQLTAEEKNQYRNRFHQREYWLSLPPVSLLRKLKRKIFGADK